MGLPPHGFFGQRAIDVVGVLAHPRWVACCDGGSDASAVSSLLGCDVASLEDAFRHRRRFSNADVGQAALAVRSACGVRMALAYAADERVASAAAQLGVALAAPAPSLKRALDDKARVRHAIRGLGLPTLRCYLTGLAELRFEAAAERVGVPFVVQPPVGSSGRGTSTIGHAADLEKARSAWPLAGCDVLVSRWGGELSVNVHAVAATTDVHVSPPSVQIVGVPAAGVHGNEYCGNDWGAAAAIKPSLRTDLVAQSRRIGRWLVTQGYTGIFGIDFVIDDHAWPIVLEVNPRMQGSTWALADVERAAGLTSTSAAHLAAVVHHGLTPPHSRLARTPMSRSTLPAGPSLAQGSQLIIHATSSGVATAAPRPGRYRFSAQNGDPHYVGDGLRPRDCGAAELLLGGLPTPGTQLDVGAVLCRLFAWRSLAGPSGRVLTPLGYSGATWARGAVTLASEGDPCGAS